MRPSRIRMHGKLNSLRRRGRPLAHRIEGVQYYSSGDGYLSRGDHLRRRVHRRRSRDRRRRVRWWCRRRLRGEAHCEDADNQCHCPTTTHSPPQSSSPPNRSILHRLKYASMKALRLQLQRWQLPASVLWIPPKPNNPYAEALSFDAPRHNPLDVVPLEKQKHCEHRYYGEDGSRHHQLGVLHVLAGQIRQRDR